MATEVVLRQGDGRVRVVFQHAPVWQKGVEPGSCPPQGLKLFRTMVCREATRATAPTAETEQALLNNDNNDDNNSGNPIFFRPVPPFDWHKKWAGTSWTWGPEAGNRGWQIEEIEEDDAWHGSAPVELWNLRLPGGIFVQSPRVITSDSVGLCRLAWLPRSETLLRMEVGLQVLQPMQLDDKDNVAAFAPPSLASMRVDVLQNMGDLEGVPSFVEQMQREEEEKAAAAAAAATANVKTENSAKDSSATTTASSSAPAQQQRQQQKASASTKDNQKSEDGESGMEAIHDALQL